MTDQRPLTWHYGLVARWWAEFNSAQPEELAFRRAVETFGEPALDLACGAGRLLVPLLAEGTDVDGADLSPDMLAQARMVAAARGLAPVLHAAAMHELAVSRRYRTIYCCDSFFGIGGHRAHDRLAMWRVYEHLEPGGAFVFNHYLPYDHVDEGTWARWLPGRHGGYPRDWPTQGDRRRLADGDEIELLSRAVDFDPFLERRTLGMRALLWHDGRVVATEENLLHENLYFAQELLFMLEAASFVEVTVEGSYTGLPATADDSAVVFVARRPG